MGAVLLVDAREEVGGVNWSYHLGGASSYHHVGGHVLGDHAAGGNDGILADGDTCQHLDVGTQPGAALDDDGLGEEFMPMGRVIGMVFGGQPLFISAASCIVRCTSA